MPLIVSFFFSLLFPYSLKSTWLEVRETDEWWTDGEMGLSTHTAYSSSFHILFLFISFFLSILFPWKSGAFFFIPYFFVVDFLFVEGRNWGMWFSVIYCLKKIENRSSLFFFVDPDPPNPCSTLCSGRERKWK